MIRIDVSLDLGSLAAARERLRAIRRRTWLGRLMLALGL